MLIEKNADQCLSSTSNAPDFVLKLCVLTHLFSQQPYKVGTITIKPIYRQDSWATENLYNGLSSFS